MHSNYWNKIANDYHNVSSVLDTHNQKYQIVAKKIIQYKLTNILDIGCGSGLFIKILYENNFKGYVTGIDSSEKMLDIARNINNKNLKVVFQNMDINKIFKY